MGYRLYIVKCINFELPASTVGAVVEMSNGMLGSPGSMLGCVRLFPPVATLVFVARFLKKTLKIFMTSKINLNM